MKINFRGKLFDVKCPVCGRTPVDALSGEIHILNDLANPSEAMTGSPGRCSWADCGFIFILPNNPNFEPPGDPSQN